LVVTVSWRDAMTVSSYLMYLLAFKIKAVCLYCLASLFTQSLRTTIMGRTWEDIGQILFTAIALAW